MRRFARLAAVVAASACAASYAGCSGDDVSIKPGADASSDAASKDGASDAGSPDSQSNDAQADGASDSSQHDAGDASDGGGPQTVTVNVGPNGNLVFSPATATLHAGDTVKWVWQSGGHTVTSGTGCAADNAFCSPNDQGCGSGATSNSGATYSRTFTQSGSFDYFCAPHCQAGMIGKVVVQ